MKDRPKKINIDKILEGHYEPNALHREIYNIKNSILKGDYTPAMLAKAIQVLGLFKSSVKLNELNVNIPESKPLKR